MNQLPSEVEVAGEANSSLPSLRRVVAALAAVFLALQLVFILGVGYGPFRDEAFYATAGMQLWRGGDYPASYYLEWFNGSPYLWPALSGGAYVLVGEFWAVRILAFVLFAASLGLVFVAVRRLVGPAPALGALVVLLPKGSGVLLAHYGTYDLLAFPFVALSLWCAARSVSSASGGRWAVLAGLALWLAALSKYPYALMGLPLALMIGLSGDRVRVRDATLFTLAAAGPFLLSMRAQFGLWMPPTLDNYNHATFPRPIVAAVVGSYVAIPLALAVAGLYRTSSDRRRLHVIAGLSIVLWPALHVLSGQITSSFKHVWMGLLVGAPAVGYGFEHLWARVGRNARLALLAVLLAAGVVEWGALEPMTYPDFRPSVEFLQTRTAPNDRVIVLADNDRWVYAMHLYAEGRVASPFEVVNQREEELLVDCPYDWVVTTHMQGQEEWNPSRWSCETEVAFKDEAGFLGSAGGLNRHSIRVYRVISAGSRENSSQEGGQDRMPSASEGDHRPAVRPPGPRSLSSGCTDRRA